MPQGEKIRTTKALKKTQSVQNNANLARTMSNGFGNNSLQNNPFGTSLAIQKQPNGIGNQQNIQLQSEETKSSDLVFKMTELLDKYQSKLQEQINTIKLENAQTKNAINSLVLKWNEFNGRENNGENGPREVRGGRRGRRRGRGRGARQPNNRADFPFQDYAEDDDPELENEDSYCV